jgi:hypothetical protein
MHCARAWSPRLIAAVLTLALPTALTPALAQSTPASTGTLTGLWQCELGGHDGEMPFALDLAQSGDQVAGRVSSPEGQLTIAASTLNNGVITVRLPSPEGTYVLTAKFTQQALTDGQVTLDGKPY